MPPLWFQNSSSSSASEFADPQTHPTPISASPLPTPPPSPENATSEPLSPCLENFPRPSSTHPQSALRISPKFSKSAPSTISGSLPRSKDKSGRTDSNE